MSAVITVVKKNGGFQNANMVLNKSIQGFVSSDEDEDNILDNDIDISSSESDSENGTSKDRLSFQIVTPGELITEDPIWMRGHGTYF
ncbi:exosome non-catalytic core subunit RRP4 PWA37_004561 [Arxiozyma heterogenica]